MSEIFSILPVSVRPYEWAKREMNANFKNPDRFWITDLDEMSFPTNVHVSIFHKKNEELAIWRVYWSDTDSVKYSILLNYEELKKNHPELVALLEANGVTAYEEEIKRFGEKRIDYQPLQPFV